MGEQRTDGWIRGWPAVRKYLGNYRRNQAVKDLVANYGLPLRTLPTGDPVLIISEVNRWLQSFSEAISPFRLKRLTGAAFISAQGGKIGGLLTNAEQAKKRMDTLFPGGVADMFGGVPHGSSSYISTVPVTSSKPRP